MAERRLWRPMTSATGTYNTSARQCLIVSNASPISVLCTTDIFRTVFVGVLGKLKQFQTLFTDFDYSIDQNFRISHNSPPDSRAVCFMVGAKRPNLGAKPPSPCLAEMSSCEFTQLHIKSIFSSHQFDPVNTATASDYSRHRSYSRGKAISPRKF